MANFESIVEAIKALSVLKVVGSDRKFVTAAATREPMAFPDETKCVLLTAELDNTGVMVLGGKTVVAALATRKGTPLEAGDSALMPAKGLWFDTTVSGDGVTYTAFG